MRMMDFNRDIKLEDINFDNIKITAQYSCGFKDEVFPKLKSISRDEGLVLGRRHIFKENDVRMIRILNIDVSNRLNNMSILLNLNCVDLLNTMAASDCDEVSSEK
jgi:hypothetical protein